MDTGLPDYCPDLFVVLSYSGGDRLCHTKSVFRLGKVCLGPSSYVFSWAEYLGFRDHFVGK